jgi:SAM-dependent methyltransferase
MSNKMATTHSTPIGSGSPGRFGYEWKTYPEMRPEYEEQFRRWTVHLSPQDWSGKAFLDVGCGMGRNSYWPLSYGASAGVAIDVDQNSLASARQTLARFPNGVVREMSAYEIDYTDFFDIAFSIGVIHHLEFPEVAIRQMVKATKPGGRVLIWVYGLENNEWLVTVVDPIRKAVFSRMPMRLLHHLAIYPTALLWVGLRLGIGRTAYFRFIRGIAFRHLRSIVLDQMLPKIAHYWPRGTVEGLMRNAGLEDVRVTWVNEMSWSGIGTKPA